jgi:VWFA-related protein
MEGMLLVSMRVDLYNSREPIMGFRWSFLFFCAALAAAQQPPPKFKARVDLALFDVEVLDRDGAPVPNLTRDDFVVVENGKAREISNFAWESDRSVSLVMVLDTSGVPVEQLVSAKRFVTRLAHVLAPDDEIALLSFDHRDAYLEMEFTRNRPSLVDVLENIEVPYSRKRSTTSGRSSSSRIASRDWGPRRPST